MDSSQHGIVKFSRILISILLLALALCASINAQPAPTIDVNQKLAGFDEFMEKTLKDWNAPGIGVGIVVGDKLVFAKGYGYQIGRAHV